MNRVHRDYLPFRFARATRLRALLLPAALGLSGCALAQPAGATDQADPPLRVYFVVYLLTPDPAARVVEVEMIVRQPRWFLREMRFEADEVDGLEGDGDVRIEDGNASWRLPERGGRLRWTASVPHERGGDGYDAWLDAEWGLFRAEDVIPRAATRTLRGAVSETRMRIEPPADWSAVTQYRSGSDGYEVHSPGRRFSQPSGWMVMGDLGVRRERIAGTSVVVAGPEDQGVRRLDMLALLNWTLPELDDILPERMTRLTVVSAGEPMWRGALSAPRSLYVHADRPLISENGTSTLLHEVMHVALRLSSETGYDWIVEGLAEYYSLELLRRSGSITASRYRRALEHLEDWSGSAKDLCRRSSSGATTARAVLVLSELDAGIRRKTKGKASLDDVLALLLSASGPVNLDRLRHASSEVMGTEPDALDARHLPGCD